MPKTNPSRQKKRKARAVAPPSESFEDNGQLMRVVPNPLKQQGEVRLDLPVTGHLRIELADFTGKNILLLFEGEYEGGVHSIPFDVGYLPPDAYLCVVEVDGNRYHRMVIVSDEG